MSGQVIELIIFAAIAFFIINKLMATLGSTSDDDPSRNKSFFGETEMKDVSNTASDFGNKIIRPKFGKNTKVKLKGLIVEDNEKEIRAGLADVTRKMPNFDVNKFLQGASVAFSLVINAGLEDNEEELEELVDQRYIQEFRSMSSSYGNYKQSKSGLNAHISEIYMFGNNVFVKILFAGKNITTKIKELQEEWTFTKSLLNDGPNWHLTNIDRPQ